MEQDISEDSLSAFVHRLSGSTRFIMDYLVEEILQRLPEDSRSFLVQTSMLERLTASLCDAVTDRHDSQSKLDALEKTNNLDDQVVHPPARPEVVSRVCISNSFAIMDGRLILATVA